MPSPLLQTLDVSEPSTHAPMKHPTVYKVQGALLGRDRLEAAMRPVVERAIGGAPTGTVVDVGGGTAEARALWPSGWRYIAVDNDERMDGIQTDSMERVTGSAEDVPLPDGVADHVLMSNVSHHLDDRTWAAALTEIRRMLRPDGTLIFVDALFVPLATSCRGSAGSSTSPAPSAGVPATGRSVLGLRRRARRPAPPAAPRRGGHGPAQGVT